MQDPAQERIKAEESAKPQPGATIGRDASSDPVVLNPNIDIPKYDGIEDPRPWIESLEEIGFLYHWAGYIISRYAAMNMIGSAKTWLNLHKISFTSWENFKSRIIEDFASDANKEEMRMRLNRMQQWNELEIRVPLPENELDEDYERLFLNQIINEKDDFIENIKENLSANKRSITQNFKEENGCLYKKNPNPEADYPFERIGIDFVGPLPSTKRRRKWIIVLTDYYNKYAETKAVSEATVKEVSTFLIEHIILRHEAPRFLISDRGSQFTSNLMKETNGLTERLNRTSINMISMYVNTDQKNWDEILPFITHAYNTTIQETTGYSPFFLLFGREPMFHSDDENIPMDSNMDDYDEYIENYLDKIARTRQVVINNTEKTQERMKRNYYKKDNEKIYELGHLVAVWTPVRKIGKCEKLLRKNFGPYRILKKLSNVNYLIEPKDNPGQDPLIVHVSRLKPYFERIDETVKFFSDGGVYGGSVLGRDGFESGDVGENNLSSIARALSKFGVRTLYSNSPNISSLIRNPDTKSNSPFNPSLLSGCVYSIPCADCDVVYVEIMQVLVHDFCVISATLYFDYVSNRHIYYFLKYIYFEGNYNLI
ncbi:hypothetical protein LAZ67_7002410 [Cordylochernes scorpioides]|uniref:Integrase catalytic domain-containing protein n=1 Tax=Cordylochernes scorpioides TaxID=51811 RepID=A0ABY6KN56_9ARAC|nr:hypothetical protein LAZ67_7002410 [Cordylochernes scorpioides]